MAGPSRSRIAEVWVGVESGGRYGSGYLVDDDYLLTAAHVVDKAEGCEARCLGQAEWANARVVWRDAVVDLALLEVVQEGWQPPRSRPLRWGRLLGGKALECVAVGFPESQERSGQVRTLRDTEQLEGTITPLSAVKSERLVVHVQSSSPKERERWRGMSGAGVFVGDVLVGVLCTVPEHFGSERLEAVPLEAALRDAKLAEILRGRETSGLPYLEPVQSGLERGWEPLPDPPWRSPSVLLQARYGVVPFRGRARELEELEAWCERGTSPLQLVVGGAGRGKSRLAIELCRRMAVKGWLSGFLSNAPTELPGGVLEHEEPALLVLDYAETRMDLERLLEPLARAGGPGRVRVLLLARAAGDWWRELQESKSADLRLLLALEEPRELAAVDEKAMDRAAAFMEAAQAFTEAQEMEPQHWNVRELEGTEFDAILQVHMAALDAVGTPPEPGPGPGARAQVPLLTAMRLREASYWRRTARARGLEAWERELQQVVAMATLVGAEDEETAVELLRRMPALRAETMEKARRDLAHWHHDIYPGGEWLAALEPDALGEELVRYVLEGTPDWAASALKDLGQDRLLRVLPVLDRTARHASNIEPILVQVLAAHVAKLAEPAIRVAIQTGDPIGRLLAKALEATAGPPQLLAHLYQRIPWHTLALREAAAALAWYQVDHARREGSQEQLAWVLDHLSYRLSELGKREEALAAIEEAVRIHRELVGTMSSEILPDLAGALSNLSARLSELGRQEEALPVVEEAVGIYQKLLKANPQTFLPGLAASLINLSATLSHLGRDEHALARGLDAVNAYGALAKDRPAASVVDLATSLSNVSLLLSKRGRGEEALAAIEGAIELRRELAELRPDAFGSSLAAALTSRASMLSELGRVEEALATIEEAVESYRALAEARPDVFLPDLAEAMGSLSLQLAELDRREDALAANREAVEVYRLLSATRPAAFKKRLAQSLNNLSRRLYDLSRHHEALAACMEAVAIRRELADLLPDEHRPDLARALMNLSAIQSRVGRRDDALAASEEAVDICRELVNVRPEEFRPDLAQSLNNLAVDLSQLGRQEEALAAAKEVVQVYRDLVEARPETFDPDLALSLNNFSKMQSEQGEYQEALAASRESVKLYRRLVEARPEAFRPDLARSLNNLSADLSNLGMKGEALRAAAEAVKIRQELALARMNVFGADLVRSLSVLSERLEDMDRVGDAQAVREYAAELGAHLPEIP